MSLLQVRDLAVHFAGIVALDGVSFDLAAGNIVGLIGPNGAGKTTLFNCLSRLYECDRGEIVFDGQSLLSAPRHRVAAMGIGRTFRIAAARAASLPTRCGCRRCRRKRPKRRAGRSTPSRSWASPM
jgi:ABC-type branched-subunit amino acid transport system ATPase component